MPDAFLHCRPQHKSSGYSCLQSCSLERLSGTQGVHTLVGVHTLEAGVQSLRGPRATGRGPRDLLPRRRRRTAPAGPPAASHGASGPSLRRAAAGNDCPLRPCSNQHRRTCHRGTRAIQLQNFPGQKRLFHCFVGLLCLTLWWCTTDKVCQIYSVLTPPLCTNPSEWETPWVGIWSGQARVGTPLGEQCP